VNNVIYKDLMVDNEVLTFVGVVMVYNMFVGAVMLYSMQKKDRDYVY